MLLTHPARGEVQRGSRDPQKERLSDWLQKWGKRPLYNRPWMINLVSHSSTRLAMAPGQDEQADNILNRQNEHFIEHLANQLVPG